MSTVPLSFADILEVDEHWSVTIVKHSNLVYVIHRDCKGASLEEGFWLFSGTYSGSCTYTDCQAPIPEKVKFLHKLMQL